MHAHYETEVPTRRIVRRITEWTLREHQVVVEHWPNVEEIRRLLPHRSLAAIRGFASRCNLRQQLHHWTAAQDTALRKRVRGHVPRKEIAAELGLTVTQVANRMQYIGVSYARRPRKPTGDHLLDAIRERQFDMNISSKELDEACGSGSRFKKATCSHKIHIRHIRRALKVLGGHLTVEWEPLEEDEINCPRRLTLH